MSTTPLFLNIPLTLITILGLLFNGYIIIAVLLTRQTTSANNLLLLHLGGVDILLGLLFLTFSLPGLTKIEWFIDGIPCIIHGFLLNLLHPVVLWTICGLNCDRYYAIAAPLHYGHIVSQKKVIIGLGAGWIISVILCIPPLFQIAPYQYIIEYGACAPNFSFGLGTLWYSTFYTAFTLLLPATLIICCNFKILMIARYHRHRIASAIYEVTLSAQVTITHQRNPFFVPTITAPSNGGPAKFRGRNAINTIFQLVGSLVTLYLPFYCLILWQSTNNTTITAQQPKILHNFYTIVIALLTCSPMINSFLYGIKNKQLRKTFQNYWRKKQTKSEVNQEIQARTPSTCGSRRPSLTPLSFLNKPLLQRRLSEVFLDKSGNLSPQRNKLQHEQKQLLLRQNWRPSSSATNLSMSTTLNSDALTVSSGTKPSLKQTASCNVLQIVSAEDEDLVVMDQEILRKIPNKEKSIPINNNNRNNNTTPNCILQKILNQCIPSTKKSPTITITRACSSDDDDDTDDDNGITASTLNNKIVESRKSLLKKHSISAQNLCELKTNNYYRRNFNLDDDDDNKIKSVPLLCDNNSLISSMSTDSSTNNSRQDSFINNSLDCSHNKSLSLDYIICSGGDSETTTTSTTNENQLLYKLSCEKHLKIDDLRKVQQYREIIL